MRCRTVANLLPQTSMWGKVWDGTELYGDMTWIRRKKARERLSRKHFGVVIKASQYFKKTILTYFKKCSSSITTSNATSMTMSNHDDVHPCVKDEHGRQRRSFRKSLFDNANTRRGLSFARSRHAKNTQRVIVFAFRQRQNTQRVVVRAIATRRENAEGHRFRVSTTPKHVEGCRSCDHDTFSAEFRLHSHFRLQSSKDRISASAPNLGFRAILGFSPRRTEFRLQRRI